ncbi:MAG: hypothetical protein FJ271_26425 [Planctomycetes bacterium]|nr:hypothetical protein [Planctomycetota bacterium]
MKKDWTPEERAAIEAKYKAEFTAADLQKYTEEDELIPLEDVIRDLEERQRQMEQEENARGEKA